MGENLLPNEAVLNLDGSVTINKATALGKSTEMSFKNEVHWGGVKAPATAMKENPILQFFAYTHLPESLQDISKPFGELAEKMFATVPNNPELSAGLRKLLEAKDCFVRAKLFK